MKVWAICYSYPAPDSAKVGKKVISAYNVIDAVEKFTSEEHIADNGCTYHYTENQIKSIVQVDAGGKND